METFLDENAQNASRPVYLCGGVVPLPKQPAHSVHCTARTSVYKTKSDELCVPLCALALRTLLIVSV
jgi:hypothetical protein